MKLNCIHCGGAFAVRNEQLGTSVACPHCRGTVSLPKVDQPPDVPEEETHGEPSGVVKNSVSGLASVIFHTALLIALALFPLGKKGLPGAGEDVFIGELPTETLSETQDESLDSADKVDSEKSPDDSLEDVEITPPNETSDPSAVDELTFNPTSLSGSSGSRFDLGAVSIGGGSEGGGWEGMLKQLRRDGLDVVIAFDSTGSMQGELDQVKAQIKRIGNTLLKLVPKSRISICTYRDVDDEYVVKGLPLTSDIQEISTYLGGIVASGGGNYPEAVDEGLRWAVTKNQFRSRGRKVILLFGDAPPHPQNRTTCLRIASDFNRQNKGVVSTVTCHSPRKLPDFVEIAEVGGGEAFLTTDERQIMTQLMVLVFGSRYRGKVVEAFELMDKK